MSCPICGRGSCTESFHSIEEQERFDAVAGMDEYQLRREVVDLRLEIKDLKAKMDTLEGDLEDLQNSIET